MEGLPHSKPVGPPQLSGSSLESGGAGKGIPVEPGREFRRSGEGNSGAAEAVGSRGHFCKQMETARSPGAVARPTRPLLNREAS